MKTSTSNIQRPTFNAQRQAVGSQSPITNHQLPVTSRRARPREEGIALVITLGVLTVILLIAVAFALSARTEAKSGSSYDILVQAKSFAKMGMDRCLMEHAYKVSSTPYSGRTGPYIANDLTQIDGSHINDTAPEFGAGNAGDFVDVDNDGVRGLTEPYWIGITNSQGKLIGRIAYGLVKDESGTGGAGAGSGSTLVDINVIGNIQGAGDTYVRSNGYYGVTNSNTSTPFKYGVAADINLIAFFEKLGYADPTLAAQQILQFRYGWDGVSAPAVNTYKPGVNGGNDNNLYGIDDIGEYDASQPRGDDRQFSGLGTTGPGGTEVGDVAPDPASSELANYATIFATDLNKVNPYGVNRVNLNSMTGAVHVPTVIQALQRAGLNDYVVSVTNLGKVDVYTNYLAQFAVNLIDFHTTNVAPTAYSTGGKNFYGIKQTPYFNELYVRYAITCLTNYLCAPQAEVYLGMEWWGELWNPYSSAFAYPCYVTISNVLTFASTNVVHPPYFASTNIVRTMSFAPPVASGGYPAVIASLPNTRIVTSCFNATNGLPDTLTITNVIYYKMGCVISGTSNIIAEGVIDVPSDVKIGVTAGVSSPAKLVYYQQDDPRVGLWYTNSAHSLGSVNPVRSPNTPAPREGLSSLYVKMSNYVSIAEFGSVYRNEPWQTLRLQPGGEGGLLDHIYVNDLNEVRGRINLNSETNGPPSNSAPLQSPAFWALFAGLSVTNTSTSSLETISSNKIEAIIANLGDYRNTLTNIVNGVTNTVFTNIGQICELSTLVTDQNGNFITYTNDAARELIIRSIADLITTRAEAGSELLAWGQVIKGNQPAGTIQIRAWYTAPDNMIRIKKFQYIRQ